MYRDQFTPIQAREALRYLKRGVCPPKNISFFTVGLSKELNPIRDTLDSIRSGAVKCRSFFLEAPYGYGKSHMLKVIESIAWEQNFAVAQVTHDDYDCAFNHPSRYIHYLYESLSIPGLSARGLGNLVFDLLRGTQRDSLLSWADKPDVRWGIGYHIRQMANTGDDADSSSHKYFVNSRDVRHRSGTHYYYLLYQRLKTLSDLCHSIGLSGLVVLFDEVESIATQLANIRSRLRAYEILGELTDSRVFPYCCFCFAVTPDFGHKIENQDYKYEYNYYMKYYETLYRDGCKFIETWVKNKHNLLQIMKIGTVFNVRLCHKLSGLHEYAYSWSAGDRISSAFIKAYVEEAERHSLLQRDIVRSFVNILDICQQHPSCNPGQELALGEAEESGFSVQFDSTLQLQTQDDYKSRIDNVLLKLPLRQRQVIHLRFGLDDGVVCTLEQIGREFDVTRERIRQVENEALKNLRRPAHSRRLRDILDAASLLDKGYANLVRKIFKGKGVTL